MTTGHQQKTFSAKASEVALALLIGLICLFPAIALLAITAVCIALPLYLLYTKPESYTPLVDVLFAIFLWLLAFAAGGRWETWKAVRRANEKWLPAAEGIIQRLMTLRANVWQFAMRTESHCDETICELPELQAPNLAAVRVKMRAECRASKERLDDIANQLEDAIADWKRFISANCHGDECQRMSEAIEQREHRLTVEMGKRKRFADQPGEASEANRIDAATSSATRCHGKGNTPFHTTDGTDSPLP